MLVLAGGLGWLAYRVESLPASKSSTTVTSATQNEPTNSGWNTTITSGKGGFSVTLPDGWGPAINAQDSDLLIIPGMTQPTVKAGNKTEVKQLSSYGSDNPSIFSMFMVDATTAVLPQGVATDVSFGKGEDMVAGKKYSYRYETDDFSGIGTPRPIGDRDYTYVFTVGDKQLHVNYSVYGSDPRNLIATVDEIVSRIIVKK